MAQHLWRRALWLKNSRVIIERETALLGADHCKSSPHPTRPPILTSLLRGRTTLFRCTRLPSPQRSYGEAGVAIDCITGRVIDKQIEVVNE